MAARKRKTCQVETEKTAPVATVRIRVLLVDDHRVLRDGIKAALKGYEDIEIVGEASDGRNAVSLARDLAPDVILLDISMPGVNGIEAARQISQQKLRAKILVLTMYDNPESVRELLANGVSGYILKTDCSLNDLAAGIRVVASGGAFFSPGVSKTALGRSVTKKPKQSPGGELQHLSNREREILILIASNYRNKEIAARLGISVRTVTTHREHIMRKLGIHGVADLTRYAISSGLAQQPTT